MREIWSLEVNEMVWKGCGFCRGRGRKGRELLLRETPWLEKDYRVEGKDGRGSSRKRKEKLLNGRVKIGK